MPELPFGLRPHLIGGGELQSPAAGTIRMLVPPTRRGYVDAQADDYQGRRRSDFPWAPPLSLRLRARASHPDPPGTLGFGFWNDPFGVSLGGAGGVRRFPASPQAMWFFYGSPPNDFAFALDGFGDRWKAAVIRSPGIPVWLMAPGAALAFMLGAIPGVRIPVVRAIRRAVASQEAPIDTPFDDWHEYRIEWRVDGVRFVIDGGTVLDTAVAPRGRLGFVTWIDNQYAVLSERRGIRFGTLPTTSEAWLEVADLEFEQG